MIRRPPRSTLSSSSAASDVYKRQVSTQSTGDHERTFMASLSAYQRVKSLGRGSCGTVDLMVQDGKYVALKHIDVESMSDKEKESTMKEVEVMAKIVHPNVVGYFCSFVEDGSLHIGMEYADGGSLQRQWKKAQEAGIHFSEKQILHWCAQICSALKYVHGMKIMHRDLKLANIMLTKQNIVKIADFGLARVLGSQTQFANTCCGTPYYLAPEVCLEKPYDQKSDSWALGCILYELCTLKRPFDAKNLPSIVMKICHGEPKPVSSAYSITLRSLIACLLEKKPHDRPSMDEITRMPFMQDSFAAIAKLVAEARPPQPPDRLKLSKRREGNASSPVPAALSEKFAAAANKVDQAGGNESISKRFSRMREKLGNDASESPRSQEQASQRLNQDQVSQGHNQVPRRDGVRRIRRIRRTSLPVSRAPTPRSKLLRRMRRALLKSGRLGLQRVRGSNSGMMRMMPGRWQRPMCMRAPRVTRPHWSLYSISPRPYCSRTTMRTTQR
eukprot:TRINITY_DN5276_c0_g1_i16.p1 TRINITY_DN5276_c0_g1~~TRINITY_DN5276_c0_g1_i16.p1  ORF type:complete len:500 (+),score=77.07 TRINITY_DN5276_c0_g1_i16:110-1609(+)